MNEDLPAPRPASLFGENLETHSIAELTARIARLQDEIARAERMIDEKRKAQTAALSAFKAPSKP